MLDLSSDSRDASFSFVPLSSSIAFSSSARSLSRALLVVSRLLFSSSSFFFISSNCDAFSASSFSLEPISAIFFSSSSFCFARASSVSLIFCSLSLSFASFSFRAPICFCRTSKIASSSTEFPLWVLRENWTSIYNFFCPVNEIYFYHINLIFHFLE